MEVAPCDDTEHEILFSYSKLYVLTILQADISSQSLPLINYAIRFMPISTKENGSYRFNLNSYTGVIHNSRIQLSLVRLRWRCILNLYALRRSDHDQVGISRVGRDIDTIATEKEHIEAFKQGKVSHRTAYPGVRSRQNNRFCGTGCVTRSIGERTNYSP